MLKVTSRLQCSKAFQSFHLCPQLYWWTEEVCWAFECFCTLTLDQLLKVCLWHCLADWRNSTAWLTVVLESVQLEELGILLCLLCQHSCHANAQMQVYLKQVWRWVCITDTEEVSVKVQKRKSQIHHCFTKFNRHIFLRPAVDAECFCMRQKRSYLQPGACPQAVTPPFQQQHP